MTYVLCQVFQHQLRSTFYVLKFREEFSLNAHYVINTTCDTNKHIVHINECRMCHFGFRLIRYLNNNID